eukprot:3527913-Pleurochrysis_carterae.AAC.4
MRALARTSRLGDDVRDERADGLLQRCLALRARRARRRLGRRRVENDRERVANLLAHLPHAHGEWLEFHRDTQVRLH